MKPVQFHNNFIRFKYNPKYFR